MRGRANHTAYGQQGDDIAYFSSDLPAYESGDRPDWDHQFADDVPVAVGQEQISQVDNLMGMMEMNIN